MSSCIYPGSFDPVHLGHIDIINRATNIFDKVYVAPAINKNKKGRFSIENRISLIEKSIKSLPNYEKIEVVTFDDLLVDFCRKNNISTILKGVRNTNDFILEQDMANAIRFVYEDLETLFIPADTRLSCISSSMVMDVLLNNSTVEPLVPKEIAYDIQKMFGGK